MSGNVGLVFLHSGDDLALALLTLFEKIKNLQPGGLSKDFEITTFQLNEIGVYHNYLSFIMALCIYIHFYILYDRKTPLFVSA
jgi:hypothetical protein